MNEQPLKYSDLVQPDSSVTDLIKQLQELNSQYDAMKSKIQGSAQQMAQGMQSVSGATEEQRKQIQATTEASEKLVAEYRDITSAQWKATQAFTEAAAAKKEAAQVDKLITQINTSAEGSYNRLSAQYRLNKLRLNEMSAEMRTATKEGQQLERETAAIYEQMNNLQKATGKYTLQVGNYEIAGKSLKGELTELTEQMAKMRLEGNANSEEYRNMAERAGKLKDAVMDAKDEVKNMGSDTRNLDSVMGATSAARGGLSAMTSLMALFGANSEGASKAQKVLATVIGVVTGLTAVANALQKESALMISLRTIKTKLFTKAVKEETAAEATHTATMEAETVATETATKATKGFQKALMATGIGALVVAIGVLIAHLSDLKSSLDDAGEAAKKDIDDMIDGLEELKKEWESLGYDSLRVQTKALTEVSEKLASYRKWLENVEESWNKLNAAQRAAFDLFYFDWDAAFEGKNKLYEQVKKEAESIMNALRALASVHDIEMAQQGMSDYEKGLDNINRKAKEVQEAILGLWKAGMITKNYAEYLWGEISEQLDYERELLKQKEQEAAAERYRTAKANAQKIADAAAEANKTEEQRLTDKYNRELAELKKYGIDTTELTKKYEADIKKVREDAAKKQEADDKEKADKAYQAERNALNTQKKGIELRLATLREGDAEELDLRVALWEKQRELELLENANLAEELQQDEAAINAKWDAYILKQSGETMKKRAEYLLKQQQDLDASEFALRTHNARQQAQFSLQQEKERLQALLKADEDAGNLLTEQQRQTMRNTIAAIEQEAKRMPYNNLYELLGIGLDSDQQSALNEALSTVKDQLSSIADSWAQAADAALASADKQVEAARKVLDEQIAAREAGYANEVRTAQKELDLAVKNQQKAQKEKERAQKAQLLMDSITQASSLVTATANIWSAFGAMPYLAIATTAIMWGAFLAAKIKAAQVTAPTETYGEGTVELLEGGSHASGHDIDLGRKRNGVRRRAEGGEYFAVINKRSSRRFRSVIPDVINSLNDGTFAERYMRANEVLASVGGPDVSGLARDVSAIRAQGEESRFVDGDGNTIIRYKNLTRKIYKS